MYVGSDKSCRAYEHAKLYPIALSLLLYVIPCMVYFGNMAVLALYVVNEES